MTIIEFTAKNPEHWQPKLLGFWHNRRGVKKHQMVIGFSGGACLTTNASQLHSNTVIILLCNYVHYGSR